MLVFLKLFYWHKYRGILELPPWNTQYKTRCSRYLNLLCKVYHKKIKYDTYYFIFIFLQMKRQLILTKIAGGVVVRQTVNAH